MGIQRAFERLMYFGSGLYLLGLLIYMGIAAQHGQAIMTKDSLLPYEVFLVAALTGYNFARVIK